MNDLSLIYHSIKSRGINSLLSVLLTAFGVSLAILITQFSNHIQNRLTADGKNIDIVVGAKGSPLQLILSSVYHVDIPTGNIPYDSVKKIMNHPQVKNVVPLALGDNWKGYRIVGTSYEYLKNYDAELEKGRLWEEEFEVLVGSSIKTFINQEFSGAHGLLEGGDLHEDKKYKVVGILKKTGTVLDRLILTSVNSVLTLHDHDQIEDLNKVNKHSDHDDLHEHGEHNDNDENINAEKKPINTSKSEITALLVQTKSPIANINLPRQINRETLLQAANPAFEMSRLIVLLGLGSKSFALLSGILIFIAILSIFSGLAGTLENRISDLTILRAIGYSKKRIFKIITLEGLLIVTLGIILGIVLAVNIFLFCVENLNFLKLSQADISISQDFIIIVVSVFFSGLVASFIPAFKSTKINIANQLSKNV